MLLTCTFCRIVWVGLDGNFQWRSLVGPYYYGFSFFFFKTFSKIFRATTTSISMPLILKK